MRLILPLLILVVVACGALFGALNGARVAIDFWFARIELPLGVALLATLLAGWIAGGVVAWLGHARRPRRRSARDGAQRSDAQGPPA